MSNRMVIIISTGDSEKARTGLMYAVNARKQGWMEDVRLFLFGPSERLYLRDKYLQELVGEFQELRGRAIACRTLAERDGIGDRLSERGIQVEYVGEAISALIREGYMPLVW